ncbi:2-keto-3-deoxy-L-rhamnonate aldolase [Geosmithia morbida]|uniref:2-keto-3-deoxy-L-rhamnonate aldolase n=1 Tax=Geosmithia morbida TaxID=1094350 RepID=A0A9P4YW89_9HYPO|nr:2-keto-3-deoxy-L-rhamnonate aldolase [Geosmithia morbida]KAF4122833.1 2-keto-3-deoxy-L-rhamnonate aldolase [Geosmithia morbida]
MAPTTPRDGVYVPSPTFFKEEPESASALQAAVDVEAQAAHTVLLARSGITGVVLMGSTGEAVHMSAAERSAIISGVREGLNAAGYPDYPIMAGVLVNSIDDTLQWLRDSHAAGANYGLVLAPGYFGPAATQENIIEWYTVIADKSPVPILIYNYPGVSNNLIVTVDTYVKLAAHPNIVGCKMSHGNVSYHVQVSLHPEIDHSSFRVFSGFGQQLGPIVVFNAGGVIDGLAAIFPKTVARLFSLAAKRPLDEATLEETRRLQWKVSSAEEFVGKFGIVGIKEAIYKVHGLGNLNGGRLPLKGSLPSGAYAQWEGGIFGQMLEEEKKL